MVRFFSSLSYYSWFANVTSACCVGEWRHTASTRLSRLSDIENFVCSHANPVPYRRACLHPRPRAKESATRHGSSGSDMGKVLDHAVVIDNRIGVNEDPAP